MKDWQFNVLFLLACGGAVALLLGDRIGIDASPEVVTVYGSILAYVLTQKQARDDNRREDEDGSPARKKPSRKRKEQDSGE